MSKEDLIVTRNGIPLEDQMEGIRQFKEAAFRAAEKAKLPQDVEEFIAKHAYQDGHDRFSCRCVSVEALHDWMTGHVRVPVEPTEAMIEAGCKQHECQQQDTWYSNDELSEYDCKAIYKAMLNASKGE